MDAAKILLIGRHIGRESSALRAELQGGRVGGRIAVLYPPIGRVQQGDFFVYRVQALPVGGRVAAVNGLVEIEARIAARDEIAVEIGNIPIGVGIDGVVGRVRAQIHHLAEALVGALPGADE